MAMDRRPIRLGVIGTGLAVEKLHWPALRQMPDRFEIAAFANHTRPKAEAFASYSGASMEDYYADYRQLLRRDDVEAVLISLPIPLNEPVTRECLEAGKHVICEKPAGGNERQAASFLQLPQQFPDQVVLVAENWFYRDDLRLARSLLDAGAIGQVHTMAWRLVNQLVPREGQFSSTPWRQQPEYRGGPHLDGGVHHIAQIRLLCGDVARVFGEAKEINPTMGGPTDLALTLHFVSGAIGSYTAVYPPIPMPPEENAMHVYGAEGVMAIGSRRVTVYRPDGMLEEHQVDSDGGYYNEFLNFYDAIVHGEPIVGTVAQNVHNMQIVLGGLNAAAHGQVVQLGPAANGVPLWRPRGAPGLFDGLPTNIMTERRSYRETDE
jgi:predicted dehydrogenase